MKASNLFAALVAGVLSLGLSANFAMAEKADKKTVSGKSACATCDGVTKAAHHVMIVAEDGTRWVLTPDSKENESYKAAHKVRKGGEKMTATLAGEPETKKDDKGKEYKEAKVSEIKVG